MASNISPAIRVYWMRIAVVAWLGALGPLLVEDLSYAQTPFYQGKTIRLLVGFTPGGVYDQYARILSRFMPKHIPGNPEIIVQNMPGAGSLVASNYIYGVAKPDVLTLGMVSSGVYLDQLVGKQEVTYDVRKFVWIGSVDQTRSLMLFVRADSPWKSIEDLLTTTEPPKCGASGDRRQHHDRCDRPGRDFRRQTQDRARLPGSIGNRSGNRKGRTQLPRHGIDHTFFPRAKFDLAQGRFRPAHYSNRSQTRPTLPDTPTLHEYMDRKKTPEISRSVARVMLLAGTLGRPMLATPGIPADRVRTLPRRLPQSSEGARGHRRSD